MSPPDDEKAESVLAVSTAPASHGLLSRIGLAPKAAQWTAPPGFNAVLMLLCLSVFATSLESKVRRARSVIELITQSAAVIIQTVGHELGPSSLVSYSISAVLFGQMAFVPVSRLAANTLGRRWSFVLFIAVFAGGSALAAGAQGMQMFIAGRVLQGAGTAGVTNITNVRGICMTGLTAQIVLVDIVPLTHRCAANCRQR